MATRVLLIESSFGFGGSTVALTRLLKGLDRSRFAPHVVLACDEQRVHMEEFGPGDVPIAVRPLPKRWIAPRRATSRLGRLAQKFTNAPRASLDAWSRARRYADELEPLAREWGTELVHLNNNVTVNMAGVLLAQRLDVPCVVKEHGFDWHSWDIRRLAKRIDHFMPDSRAVAADLIELGIEEDRITTTYCPVEVDLYGGDHDRAAIRTSLGLPTDAPVVGMLGCLLSWKGQHVFVEAAARALRLHPAAHAVLVGDVPVGADQGYRTRLAERIAELGLADRIHLAGHRDDVPAVLSAIDVCVHASIKPEPFGMVIVEAMASRRPVIAANAGGPPEFVRDGVTGFLVEPGSADALASRIDELLRSPTRARRMGEAGRMDVARRFGLPRHVALTQDVYERVLTPARIAVSA